MENSIEQMYLLYTSPLQRVMNNNRTCTQNVWELSNSSPAPAQCVKWDEVVDATRMWRVSFEWMRWTWIYRGKNKFCDQQPTSNMFWFDLKNEINPLFRAVPIGPIKGMRIHLTLLLHDSLFTYVWLSPEPNRMSKTRTKTNAHNDAFWHMTTFVLGRRTCDKHRRCVCDIICCVRVGIRAYARVLGFGTVKRINKF